MDQNPNSSTKADRKTIEKNRREQMKALCSRLTSLIANQSSREAGSLHDQLDTATNYITTLQANLEKLRKKKNRLVDWSMRSSSSAIGGQMANGNNINNDNPQTKTSVDVLVVGSAVEVVLITAVSSRHHSVFTEAVRVLHEEGAEVVNACYSVLENAVFYTIHSKIGDEVHDGFGNAAARISERLKKFAYDIN